MITTQTPSHRLQQAAGQLCRTIRLACVPLLMLISWTSLANAVTVYEYSLRHGFVPPNQGSWGTAQEVFDQNHGALHNGAEREPWIVSTANDPDVRLEFHVDNNLLERFVLDGRWTGFESDGVVATSGRSISAHIDVDLRSSNTHVVVGNEPGNLLALAFGNIYQVGTLSIDGQTFGATAMPWGEGQCSLCLQETNVAEVLRFKNGPDGFSPIFSTWLMSDAGTLDINGYLRFEGIRSNEVPEPASAVLFSSALGLIWKKRRSQKL